MKKVTVHKIETLFQGYFRLERWHISHERFDGGMIGPFTREVFQRGHAVAVLPYDPARDEVVLIEQFRAGALAAGDPNPWTLEIVAGVIESGEAPEEVARRETDEEAHCAIGLLEPVMNFYATNGSVTETVQLYVGQARTEGLEGIGGLSDEHEDIKIHVLPFDTAMDLLEAGKIRTSPAIITLQWLALHRDEIRERWMLQNVGQAIV